MPVEVVWDNQEQTILRQVYSGILTMQDYIHATDEFERMAKTQPHTVHSIMDRSEVVSTPAVVLPALRYANSHVPPNMGLRVIVNAGVITRFVVDIGRRVAPKLIQKIYFTRTLDEARAVIRQYMATSGNRT
ncbi:MAG: hypothetical protein U0694_19215 [Anaerolineae bacterium]